MRLSHDRAPTHAPQAQTAVGFTLIELMVVIGIIVLAAGLMTPTIARRLSTWPSTAAWRLSGGQPNLVDELRR